MLVLGITTSTPQIGVALGDADGVRASWAAVRGRHHAELITPAITQVCEAADVELADIGVVAVDTGPGLFTGLRVGVATAKATAFALGVPVVTVSSLDLLAFRFRYTARRVTAAIDARRSELFVASYVAVPGGMQRLDDAHTSTADDLAAALLAEPEERRGGPHLIVGNGAQRYADVFAHLDRVELTDTLFPSAESLVRLAHPRAVREEGIAAGSVVCTYLREPDAEINWQTRDGTVHRGDDDPSVHDTGSEAPR